MMTREEHLAWCKRRALEYLGLTPPRIDEAVASMTSDLSKHPETAASAGGPLGALALWTAANGDVAEARRFIEGFN